MTGKSVADFSRLLAEAWKELFVMTNIRSVKIILEKKHCLPHTNRPLILFKLSRQITSEI
jgi:hypothetical protein